ncbi:MAG: polyphosphate:AMP phosphotransferase [Polyangiaceae bacterium]
MFESAELGHKVDAETYDAEVHHLRERLLRAQAEVFRKKAFPVIVVISGFEAAGKGDTLHTLHEWMDSRHIETHAFDRPDCVERRHPAMWRFWQALPRAGDVGIFFGAWYRSTLYSRVYGGEKRAELERELAQIARFEQMLTDEGALLVKYWLHLPKKEQRKKLEELESNRRTRWRVKASDWRNHERYGDFRKAAEEMLHQTSSHQAPWIVVEGTDARYRRLTVARTLLDAMRARLADHAQVHVSAPPIVTAVDNRKLLRDLDLTKALAKNEYEKRLAKAQGALAQLSRRAAKRKRAAVLVFEGPDAAGKGGTIRRITAALDARHYRVTAISAPSEEERAHPYLWRFWRTVPRGGSIEIFDRSWYGRVLVERVEELCPESVWMRAYSEINDFEGQLVAHGIVVMKFWLAISKAEQLRRFHEREDEADKRFKLTGEDWRNRKRWDAYEQAVCDTYDRTSTSAAPWTIVEANDKPYARVKVLETIVARFRDEV